MPATGPSSSATSPSIPVVCDNDFNLPVVNPELSNKFHRMLTYQVENELRRRSKNCVAYDNAYGKSMKMLNDNRDHTAKPSLGHLANVIYRYTDPETNFKDVINKDPLVAVWAGHLFICLQNKV
jgi:hypothetical protein